MPTLAQQVADSRTDLPTSLGTAELRKLGAEILRQSLFSARMNNAQAVQALRTAIEKILAGDNIATVRLQLKQLGAALKYDPASGFPGAETVPPAEAGSKLDLFSTERLNFILGTQQMMTQGAAKNIWGNTPDAVEQYPAWELVRVAAVELPRGLVKRAKGRIEQEPDQAWDSDNGRWQAACEDAGDDEALKIFTETGRMVARKDSGVWQALGDGAGGHDDGLGNDYEPFAFNSGMGRVEVSRQEFIDLGGDPDGVDSSDTDFGADEIQVKDNRFDKDILTTLIDSLKSGAAQYKVKVTIKR